MGLYVGYLAYQPNYHRSEQRKILSLNYRKIFFSLDENHEKFWKSNRGIFQFSFEKIVIESIRFWNEKERYYDSFWNVWTFHNRIIHRISSKQENSLLYKTIRDKTSGLDELDLRL